jgi:hypothetical protein
MTTTDDTIRAIELADHHAHTTSASRGRWMLPLLQGFTSAAVVLARRVDRANRDW